MRVWAPAVRWIAWGVAGLIALLVALGAAGYVYLQTETGRRVLADTVGTALSGPNLRISVGTIGAGLPARLAVESVVLSDDQGPWLTLERAVIEWQPLALLTGTARVTNVDAAGLHLERVPPGSETEEPVDTAPADGFEIPTLPVDVQVDRISIRDIALSEAVTGEAMVLDVSGKVGAEAGGVARTDLRIERTDADGFVTLVSELDQASQSLSVDLQVSEPEGGLMVRLLGLAPYPPVTVMLKGEGPLNAWRANLDADIQGLAAVTAHLSVDRERTIAIALEGRADVSGLLDPPLRPLVAEGIGFAVAAHLPPDLDAVTIDRLNLETKAVSASGSGRVDLAGNSVDAMVSLAVPTGDELEPLLSPLGVGSVAGDVKVSGALSAPAVDLVATVREIAAPGVATAERLEMSAGVRLSEDPVAIEARLDGHGLKVSEPAAGALTGGTAAVEVSAAYDETKSILRITRAEVNSGPTALSAHGEFGLSTQQLAATVDVDVTDVSALGGALGVPISGPLRLTAQTEGNLETLNLEGTLKGEIPKPSVGHAAADELLRDGVRLSGSYTLAGADSVRFDALVDAGKLLQLDAKGRIEDTIAADARLTSGDLSIFSAIAGTPLSGALSVSAHAEGGREQATGTLSAALRHAAVAGVAIPTADLNIEANDLMQSPSGRLALDASTGQGPVNLRTDFTLEKFASADLRGIQGEILGARIAGSLRAPFDGGAVVGGLQATFEAPGAGREVAGVGVAGRADLNLRLGDTAGKQSADLRVDASSLAIAVDGDPAFHADQLSVTAAMTDALGAPRGKVALEGRDLGTAAFTASTVTADMEGSLADAGFQVRLKGAGEPDVRVALDGRYAMSGDRYTVTLLRLDGMLGTYPLKLARPAAVTYGPGTIGLEDVSLGVGKGSISGNGQLGGARTAATIRVAGLPLDLVSQFDPEIPLQGTLDANADVRADGRGLGGKATFRGRGLTQGSGNRGVAPPVDLDVNALWRGGRVDLDARVGGLGSQDLVATASGPLVVDARSLRTTVDQRAPIAAKVRWAGQVEPLWELLPLTDQRLAGQGRIVIDVAGTLAEPRPTGEIVIQKGTYEQFLAGTLIKALDVRVSVDQRRTVKVSLSGNDGGSGRISGDGTANMADLAGTPAQVTVRFDKATLVRRDDITASATGSVSFRGTAARGRLEGKITTDRVDIRLVDKLPPSVVTLDVTEVHAKGHPTSEMPESKQAEPSLIDLDLTLDLPRAVYIQGRGLESEWGGSFRVTGTTGTPRVEGTLSIIRGQFNFVGKRFRLAKGVVTLDGGKNIEPRIDIAAEYTSGDFTATISISGPASDPKLALSSSPPMPESEILPRILFGKDSSQLSAVQAAQLALALQGLASGGSSIGDDVISRIRDTFGIDVLSVENVGEDGQGTGVRVGRYIGDRIYVETVQGSQPGSTVYRVQVKITDTLSAESSIGQGTENASGFVGLRWEYRY